KDMRDQSNYASFDCGATVLASNGEAKGATAILFDTKEQYMLNRCSAEKFVVVELCDEILVDTVMLANHEFFSSMFKDFRISVTDQYVRNGRTNWHTLGHYQARNARDLQAFHVENPILWARYLRIDFLSHYGNEYYCPVSVLRVYGPTMMEQYRREEQAAEATIADQLLKEAVVVDEPAKPSETAHVSTATTAEASATTTMPSSGPSTTMTVHNASMEATATATVHDHPASASSPSPSPSPIIPIIPPAPSATTQESIFRTITKRLSALELNLTLSHRYLEEQSRELNRVFANVE
ncbi:UNC-like C-terminal-domain-containing protein, partial [Syncephalis pseudoplumigaleata]